MRPSYDISQLYMWWLRCIGALPALKVAEFVSRIAETNTSMSWPYWPTAR